LTVEIADRARLNSGSGSRLPRATLGFRASQIEGWRENLSGVCQDSAAL